MSNYSEQFLKQNPLAVGVLRDLQRRGAAAHQLVKQSVHQQDHGCFCRGWSLTGSGEHETAPRCGRRKSR